MQIIVAVKNSQLRFRLEYHQEIICSSMSLHPDDGEGVWGDFAWGGFFQF